MRALLRTIGILGCGALLASAACSSGGGDPLAGGGEAGEVTVGSASFPENVLLAEIFAQALEADGVAVDRQFNIGSREIYFGQIQSGAITVLPEYNGALLAVVDPESTASTTEDINEALRAALPEQLQLLDAAEAQNKDALVVTAETAERFNLTTIADLQPVAGELKVGAAPEFKTRQQGIVGLQEVYGVEFAEFVPTDNAGPLTISALERGDIQVANIYTTDPSLKTKPFVVLGDPESVFGAQNITPLVYREGISEEGVSTLNEVSANLTTEVLAGLVSDVVTDQQDPDDVASDWLASVGLN